MTDDDAKDAIRCFVERITRPASEANWAPT